MPTHTRANAPTSALTCVAASWACSRARRCVGSLGPPRSRRCASTSPGRRTATTPLWRARRSSCWRPVRIAQRVAQRILLLLQRVAQRNALAHCFRSPFSLPRRHHPPPRAMSAARCRGRLGRPGRPRCGSWAAPRARQRLSGAHRASPRRPSRREGAGRNRRPGARNRPRRLRKQATTGSGSGALRRVSANSSARSSAPHAGRPPGPPTSVALAPVAAATAAPAAAAAAPAESDSATARGRSGTGRSPASRGWPEGRHAAALGLGRARTPSRPPRA